MEKASIKEAINGNDDSKYITPRVLNKFVGAKIVESGSNSKGEWVKYADGTMICSGRIAFLSLKLDVLLKDLYCSAHQQLNYPQTFVDVPHCVIDVEQNITTNSYAWITKVAPLGTNEKTPGFYITAPTSLGGTGTYGFYVDYIAKGRWK